MEAHDICMLLDFRINFDFEKILFQFRFSIRLIATSSIVPSSLPRKTVPNPPFPRKLSRLKVSLPTLKNKLINYPILGYPMFDRVFRITSDASIHAIGATLTQMQPSGIEGETEKVERVIAYTSKQLSESQYKFSTIKKELFALFHATKVWHCYLFFNEVHAYTDHAPLRWLKEQKPEHGRLFSWSQRLKLYNLKVFYKLGKVNQAADTLSRINKNIT